MSASRTGMPVHWPVISLVIINLSSYGRIETLSGFANGIFLILISVFIVFEAIQRMYVVTCRIVG